jgi:hypothetical protein
LKRLPSCPKTNSWREKERPKDFCQIFDSIFPLFFCCYDSFCRKWLFFFYLLTINFY